MDSKMIAIAYLISLGVFFVFLVIATIAVIAGAIKKKRKAKKAKKAKYVEDDIYEDESEDNSKDMSIFDEAITQVAATQQPVASVSVVESTASKQDNPEPIAKVEKPEKEYVKEEGIPQNVAGDSPQVVPIISTDNIASEHTDQNIQDKDSADEEFVDSAFTDSAFAEPNYDNESFPGSVFENIESQPVTPAATSYAQGVANPGMSQPSPAGNFYWFNKEDVADRPDYKPVEMYYRHFRNAEDCIEDLLIEMYDCALVRTEEIRYIAFGIEPRHVAMRDVAATGNAAYNAAKKRKEPSKEDLDKIYRKWCSYVDKLFEIVEFHADNTTIGIIRDKLYEFGKSDVNTIIEGK